jgi:hypothetical protein
MIISMINRYMLHKWRQKWSDDFVTFCRAFSQPINPRWARGGDLALAHATKPSGSNRALRRREKICKLRLEDVNENIRKAIEDFLNGTLALPPALSNIEKKRVSNWASASLKSVLRKYPWGADVDGNWFLEDKELEDGEVIVVTSRGFESALSEVTNVPVDYALTQDTKADDKLLPGNMSLRLLRAYSDNDLIYEIFRRLNAKENNVS